ncbi:MAG: bifunctional phosphoglucose/phosphomannose isomerase [Candidatus Heimdallarchaeota archaeon]|nr:bifunctional phosphoglucose/phosphomannose isomerase [Candidatus Heimdallarchaeota archaeon]
MKQNLDEFKSQIEGFGKLFLEAYDETTQLSPKDKNIIICGMGGSGITANYVKSLANHFQSKKQIVVWKEYELPSYITDEWFALVISYSGNTEETIAMTSELIKKGVETQIMTSGGQLMEMAKTADILMHKINKGYQPRYALPMILGKTIKLFTQELGFDVITKIQREEILNFTILENQQIWINVMKSCKSKKIVILSDNLFSPVALRFRCQLNENSKLIAQNYILPEFNHNAIVGLETIHENDYVFFIISNEAYEHKRTRIQRNFVEDYLRGKNVEVININMNYTDLIIHILSITRNLDFISFLIAQDMGTDPIKVESISQLKSKLQEI